MVTAAAVIIMSAWGAYALKDSLEGYGLNIYLTYGIPTLVLAGICFLVFLITNSPRGADFLIATESEMKKVSWSTKTEVIGSTKVVIITTLILAALLFLVDFAFANFFRLIGVTP